ncbi:MAG: hypothetical protein ACEPO8_02390 [Rhodothermaceae bacterium]
MIYSSKAITEIFEEVSDLSKVDGFTYNFCFTASGGCTSPDDTAFFLEDQGNVSLEDYKYW